MNHREKLTKRPLCLSNFVFCAGESNVPKTGHTRDQTRNFLLRWLKLNLYVTFFMLFKEKLISWSFMSRAFILLVFSYCCDYALSTRGYELRTTVYGQSIQGAIKNKSAFVTDGQTLYARYKWDLNCSAFVIQDTKLH